jgi:shikimate kinase
MKPGHVILIGLPGAGKSTAGPAAAGELGVGFHDLDALVEAAVGRTITDILASDGEAAFRELERDAMARALAQPPQVIASGGGWAAQPGNLEAVAGKGIVVYLQVSPAQGASRLGDSTGRPILSGGPLIDKLTELLARRDKHYRKADQTVNTDGKAAAEVASAIAVLARKFCGL